MNYDYDIFISFAQSENSGVDIEWSLKFCNLLDNLLNKMTNEKPVIITSADIEARVNMFHVSRQEIYEKSAVFVIILSEESLKDPDFIQELNTFSEYLESHQFGLISKSYRVFKIMSSPVSFEKIPEFLRYETSFNFYETNLLNGRTQLFNLTYDSKKDNIFWSRLVDLAYESAEITKQLRANNKIETDKSKKTIYLASCTPDQEESRDIIKRDLKQLGYNVLPDFDLPGDGETFKEIVENLLHNSSHAIHILGGYYGNYLNELPYSAVEYQNKITTSYLNSLDDNTQFDRIIWISSDTKIIEQKQRLYIGRIKRDESINNSEIIECPLEDIKSIINNKISPVQDQTETGYAKLLFFQYPDGNNDDINKIIDILNQSDSEVITSEMLTQDNIMQVYWDNLLNSDILIFYYNGNKFWLDFKIKDALKIRGYSKGQKEMKVLVISENGSAPTYDFIKNYTIINNKDLQDRLPVYVS